VLDRLTEYDDLDDTLVLVGGKCPATTTTTSDVLASTRSSPKILSPGTSSSTSKSTSTENPNADDRTERAPRRLPPESGVFIPDRS